MRGLTLLAAGLVSAAAFGSRDANALNSRGFALLRELHESERNVLISPPCIDGCIGMAWLASEGETAREMELTLGVGAGTVSVLGDAMKSWRALDKATVRSACGLWASRRVSLDGVFRAALEEKFGASIRKADFSRPAAVAEEINDFVSDVTEGMIKDAVDTSAFHERTRLALASALYFKSKWLDPFDPKETCPGEFVTESGEKKKVLLMWRKGYFACARQPSVSIVAIPYACKDLELLVFVPHGGLSLSGLLAKLEMVSLAEVRAKMFSLRLELLFPKVCMDNKIDLKAALRKLGMRRAFDARSAQLTKVRDDEGDKIVVDEIRHIVKMDIDEGGTVAAAATTSCPYGVTGAPIKFKVNCPFVAVVYDRSSQLALFAAAADGPE